MKLSKPTQHPLFQRVLAQHWDALPAPVRDMHDFEVRQVATGSASVERGNGILVNVIAWVFGFPKAADPVPVEVTFLRSGTGEIWTRRFGESSFTTQLNEHSETNRETHLVVESFGPLAFSLELRLDGERLYLSPVAWRLLGIPLPMHLAPYGNSYEFSESGSFAFHIEVCLPIAGLIVRYRGALNPETV